MRIIKTIDTEKIEELKTLYKQVLDKRDAYIKDDSVYIENKRKKIGLLSSDNLAELCFSLKFKMEASILIFNDIIDDMLNPPPKDQYFDDMELLEKLLKNPAITQRLNIDPSLLLKITQEIIDEIKNSIVPITMPYSKRTDSMYINKCAAKLFLEMDNQEEPNIRPTDQIDFVLSLYSRFKYHGYNYHGDNVDIIVAHFRAVEQQRLRALKSQ